jgi:uncharacterized protein YceH (UPF0502 family)
MGATQTIWNALTTIIQMEERVKQQARASIEQQAKIEALTERVIRLEAQMDMLLIGAGAKTPPRRLR